MLVKNWMSKVVITIEADDSIQAGMKLLKQHQRPGSIKEVANIIRGYNGRIVSVLSSYERVPEGLE